MNSWTVSVGRQWRVVSGIVGVILVSLGLGSIVLGLRSPAAAARLASCIRSRKSLMTSFAPFERLASSSQTVRRLKTNGIASTR